MQVTVLLFGPQATLAGTREITVEPAEPTAGSVLAALATAAAEPLVGSLGTSRLAVNHEFAEDTHPIRPGDEVALIGMVSGG